MPIYEYRCDACDHELERLQKMSDEPLTDCPACGKPALRRLISAAGFRLKGGGWYETDFKSKGQRNLANDGKASGDGKSAGSDSKPSDGKKSGSKKSDSSATSSKATTAA